VDYVVDPAPQVPESRARAPLTEVTGCDLRQEVQAGADGNGGWDQPAQLIECGPFGTEDGTQYRVERDPVHRLEYFEFLTLGPGLDLVQHFLFDDLLVVHHSLAVERREHQFPTLELLLTCEAERRTRAEHLTEIRWAFHELAAGAEQILHQDRIADDYRRTPDG
jgi:hypothetical protein